MAETMERNLLPALTIQHLREQREAILALMARYGAYHVRVFGSVARGEATSQSDVDFLVSVSSGVTVFDLVGLWLDLKALLQCEVSLVTDGIPDQRFLERIQNDLVEL